MPVVIPIIAAFASGAVAAVAAGTATFAAYATVAGAVLSVAGAVTHNKDLSRIGAIVGIVGGVASLAGGASGAAAAGEAVDQSAAETARLAAQESAAAGGAAVAEPVAQAGGAGGLVDAGSTPPDVTGGVTVTTPGMDRPVMGLADKAAQIQQQQGGLAAADATVAQPAATNYAGPGSPGAGGPTDVAPPAPGSIASISKQYNAGDLNDWWSKVQQAGKAVGGFIKDNKEVVSLAGKALESMYGPAAEGLDYQKSLMERARRNVNTPIPISYTKPGG